MNTFEIILLALAVLAVLACIAIKTQAAPDPQDEVIYCKYSQEEQFIICPHCHYDNDVKEEPAKGTVLTCERCDKMFSYGLGGGK